MLGFTSWLSFSRHRRRHGRPAPLAPPCQGRGRRSGGRGQDWDRLLSAFVLCLMVCLGTSQRWGEAVDREEEEAYFLNEPEGYTRVPLDPVFLKTDANITVREGARAELPCRIRHLGTKRVSWRRVEQDKFLSVGAVVWASGTNVVIQHTEQGEDLDDWTLVLMKTIKTDAGMYECKITSIMEDHVRVQLNVVGPPITEPALMLNGTEFVERGAKIKLTCKATGGKQIADEIDWFKDGNIITSEKHRDYIIYKYMSIQQGALISELSVDRANEKHKGTYVCRSSHNKLKDITVQVLVADTSNVKRGTLSSSNSTSCPLHPSAFCLFIGFITCQWAFSR